MKTRGTVCLVAIGLLMWGATAGASESSETRELTGIGKAKLSATIEEVRKSYPKMEELTKELGASVVGGPYSRRYVLWKHAVEGLPKPADVELRFWKGKLWVIVVYFGDNEDSAVVEALTQRLGPIKGDDNLYAVWKGEKTQTVLARNQRYYYISDEVISEDARAVFVSGFKQALGQSVSVNVPASATPAAEGAKPTPAPEDTPAPPTAGK